VRFSSPSTRNLVLRYFYQYKTKLPDGSSSKAVKTPFVVNLLMKFSVTYFPTELPSRLITIYQDGNARGWSSTRVISSEMDRLRFIRRPLCAF
jgi:hypothetical protein